MPDSRSAVRAELTIENATAVRRPRPGLDLALQQPEPGAPNEKRHAEGRGRLLAAFPAVADIKRFGCSGDLIANGAALAAAGERGLDAGCDHRDPPSVSTLANLVLAPSSLFSNSAMKARRGEPGGIAGRNSSVMVPGFLWKLRRPQKRPELSATGTTGKSSWL